MQCTSREIILELRNGLFMTLAENNDPTQEFKDKYGHAPDIIELWWYVRYNRPPSTYEHQVASRMLVVKNHQTPITVGEGDCEICGRQAGLDFKTIISGNNAEQAAVFKAKICFDCYSRLGSNDKVYEAIIAARESRKKPETSEESHD